MPPAPDIFCGVVKLMGGVYGRCVPMGFSKMLHCAWAASSIERAWYAPEHYITQVNPCNFRLLDSTVRTETAPNWNCIEVGTKNMHCIDSLYRKVSLNDKLNCAKGPVWRQLLHKLNTRQTCSLPTCFESERYQSTVQLYVQVIRRVLSQFLTQGWASAGLSPASTGTTV